MWVVKKKMIVGDKELFVATDGKGYKFREAFGIVSKNPSELIVSFECESIKYRYTVFEKTRVAAAGYVYTSESRFVLKIRLANEFNCPVGDVYIETCD